jgi:hypothetical protein
MVFPEMETPKPVADVEASGTKWDLVAANEDLIDSIVYKAVGDKRIPREDAKEAIANAWLLARQLAERHKGTDEEYKHYLSFTLKRRLKWDKTHAIDAMDWQDWQELQEDQLPDNPADACPARADATVPPPEELIRTLPARQQVIARLVAEGKNIHQIAGRLGRTPSQVAHLRGEMTKIKNTLEANKRRTISS